MLNKVAANIESFTICYDVQVTKHVPMYELLYPLIGNNKST